MKIWIGIDNGTSNASIGIIRDNGSYSLESMPTRRELSYTKKKQWITRIDYQELYTLLAHECRQQTQIAIERPMVNPQRFKASTSALRALEAVLIVIEQHNLAHIYVDSKQWQKMLLPSGLKTDELKRASLSRGRELFPGLENKLKDYDGLLIAEYLRRK